MPARSPAQLLSLVALVLSAAGPALAATDSVERFAVVSNGQVIGAVVVSTAGAEVDVDFRVDDNGRGEKQREHIVLGPGGVPIRWSVEGTRNAGAPVKELFERTEAGPRWSSLDGQGEASLPGPTLYLPNDGSTWCLGLYLRLLREAPGQRLGVLPAGELRAEKVRDVRVSSSGRPGSSCPAARPTSRRRSTGPSAWRRSPAGRRWCSRRSAEGGGGGPPAQRAGTAYRSMTRDSARWQAAQNGTSSRLNMTQSACGR